METPESLERQICRIHELLERSRDDVTWNDHIPDPDNPTQLRQIDVTVRRSWPSRIETWKGRTPGDGNPRAVPVSAKHAGVHLSIGLEPSECSIAIQSKLFSHSYGRKRLPGAQFS